MGNWGYVTLLREVMGPHLKLIAAHLVLIKLPKLCEASTPKLPDIALAPQTWCLQEDPFDIWNGPFLKGHVMKCHDMSIFRGSYTGWWFHFLLIFTPVWGNDPIWRAYFSKGVGSATN